MKLRLKLKTIYSELHETKESGKGISAIDGFVFLSKRIQVSSNSQIDQTYFLSLGNLIKFIINSIQCVYFYIEYL